MTVLGKTVIDNPRPLAPPIARCPFCGEEPYGAVLIVEPKTWAVVCRFTQMPCGATGPKASSPSDAIGKWNTRITLRGK